MQFILDNELSPFSTSKSYLKPSKDSIFKTRDAKAIHQKVLTKISSNFKFPETSNIWHYFQFTDQIQEILRRQYFFKQLTKGDNTFLRNLSKPRQTWSPKYEIIIVTEDESTFVHLKNLSCPVQLLVSERDVQDLENYDIVQVINCDDYKRTLEQLPQTVFIDSVDNVYLERYLELLSGWKDNFNIIKQSNPSEEVQTILRELEPLFNLIDSKMGKIISIEEVEKVLEDINEKISNKVKELTISGDSLLKMLSEGKMPPTFQKIIEDSIEETGLSQHIFNIKIPVEIDQKELDDQIKRQSANEFTNLAENIKRHAESLKTIPIKLKKLSTLLLIEDFCLGVANFIQENTTFPAHAEHLTFSNASNMFLDNAQPVSFKLDNFHKCSILTGANSGGKTTLIEHILQNISLFQLGLPIRGEIQLPTFSEVYYFAKNKGSASKGAFETLLTQMSKIRPGNQTLILADEIESVTEPGVAGKIIASTAEFFIKKNCFMVLATHLGHEIKKTLPKNARIDGIEAKGLDSNYNLIVDHNPVLGRLAHSTPELIVERMANSSSEEYFKHLHENLKKNGDQPQQPRTNY